MEQKKDKRWLAIPIIAIASLITYGMVSLKEEPGKESRKIVAPLVNAEAVQVADQPMIIETSGSVRSVSEVNLIPQVAGNLVKVAENMAPGASFTKGEALFQIDNRDYKYRYQAAQAEVARQEVMLQSEQYESEMAKSEWEEFAENDGAKPSDLTLRIPQLKMAEANLNAAKANLNLAKLNYDRATIRAPFTGMVKQRMADKGQFVAMGQILASVFSTERSEIQVTLPIDHAKWVSTGNRAMISYGKNTWNGNITHVGGSLDSRSRLLTITVDITKPYEQSPPLLNGLYADVAIHSNTIPNVAKIQRHLIKNDNQVWVLKNGALEIRTVDVLRHGKNFSYVNGLSNGELLVTTQLSLVVPGMKLRTN